MKKDAQVKSLLPEVGEKYSVAPGIGIGEMVFMGQTIHLDKITLAEADELAKNKNFTALVAKPVKPAKA